MVKDVKRSEMSDDSYYDLLMTGEDEMHPSFYDDFGRVRPRQKPSFRDSQRRKWERYENDGTDFAHDRSRTVNRHGLFRRPWST